MPKIQKKTKSSNVPKIFIYRDLNPKASSTCKICGYENMDDIEAQPNPNLLSLKKKINSDWNYRITH